MIIDFISGLFFMGFIIGIAGIAGSIELGQSPKNAIIIMIISFIAMFIIERIDKHDGHY